MSTSNLRAKQLIGLMVIEDWRYCLLPPTLEVTFLEFESFYIILFVSGPYVDTADPYPPNSQVLQSWVDNVDLSVGVFTFLAEDFNLKIDKKFINILVDLTKARSVGDFTHTSPTLPFNCAFSLRASFNNPLLYFLTRSEWRYFSHHCEHFKIKQAPHSSLVKSLVRIIQNCVSGNFVSILYISVTVY